jgi:hypothetical protein
MRVRSLAASLAPKGHLKQLCGAYLKGSPGASRSREARRGHVYIGLSPLSLLTSFSSHTPPDTFPRRASRIPKKDLIPRSNMPPGWAPKCISQDCSQYRVMKDNRKTEGADTTPYICFQDLCEIDPHAPLPSFSTDCRHPDEKSSHIVSGDRLHTTYCYLSRQNGIGSLCARRERQWLKRYVHLALVCVADLCSETQNPQTCTERSDAILKSLVWPSARSTPSESASQTLSVQRERIEPIPSRDQTQPAASQGSSISPNTAPTTNGTQRPAVGGSGRPLKPWLL